MAAVKYPNSKYFKKELEKKKLDNIYLFLGEEEGEKDKFINIILDLVFQNDPERQNSTGHFHLENEELKSAADFALSQSMFSKNRVCIMRNIDSIKLIKVNISLFHDIIENFPDSTILIMTTIKKKPPAFISSDILKQIKIVQFWRYYDNDISKYIKNNIRNNKMKIDDEAVALLIKRTGKDIRKIDDAIEIIKYSGHGGVITINLISNLIQDVRNVSINELIDSLFKKEKHALRYLKKALEDGTHELQILSIIMRQAETLEKFYIQVSNGVPGNQAINNCGIFKTNRDNFLQYTKCFNINKIKSIFPIISRTDFQLKSTKFSKELIANPLFNLVTEIIFA